MFRNKNLIHGIRPFVEEWWLQVNSSSRRAKVKAPPEPEVVEILVQTQQGLGTFRSGSLPNVAAPEPPTTKPEVTKVPQFGICFFKSSYYLEIYLFFLVYSSAQ